MFSNLPGIRIKHVRINWTYLYKSLCSFPLNWTLVKSQTTSGAKHRNKGESAIAWEELQQKHTQKNYSTPMAHYNKLWQPYFRNACTDKHATLISYLDCLSLPWDSAVWILFHGSEGIYSNVSERLPQWQAWMSSFLPENCNISSLLFQSGVNDAPQFILSSFESQMRRLLLW